MKLKMTLKEFKEAINEAVKEVMQEDGKWIPKKLEKGALHKKMGVPEDQTIPVDKLKTLKTKLQKKGEGEKKLSAADLKTLQQVNFALTAKGFKKNEALEILDEIFMAAKKKPVPKKR